MTRSAPHSLQLPPHVVSLPSSADFLTTISRIESALAARSIVMFAKLDQARAAADVHAELRPTVLLLFGSPAVGTPIMAANPHTAVELPLKAVVWEDDAGRVFVDYYDAAKALTNGYGLDAALLEKLEKIAGMLTSAIAG